MRRELVVNMTMFEPYGGGRERHREKQLARTLHQHYWVEPYMNQPSRPLSYCWHPFNAVTMLKGKGPKKVLCWQEDRDGGGWYVMWKLGVVPYRLNSSIPSLFFRWMPFVSDSKTLTAASVKWLLIFSNLHMACVICHRTQT